MKEPKALRIKSKEKDFDIESIREEFEKYLQRDGKEKKIYSVSLTKENVNYLKKRLKYPFSKFVDERIDKIVCTLKKMDEEKKKDSGVKK